MRTALGLVCVTAYLCMIPGASAQDSPEIVTADSLSSGNLPQDAPGLQAPDIDAQISAFVRRIFQDSSGNLWFGTNGDGVICYDGYSLEYFSLKEGFGGAAVRGIVEDQAGDVWFGGWLGLYRFDGKSFVNVTSEGPWR